MKKLFTIVCVVMLTLNLSAQYGSDVQFGIVGGLNVAYPVGDDMDDLIDDIDDYMDYYDDQPGIDAKGGIKPRIGIHLGFSLDYPFSDNLHLSSGIIYSQKGFSRTQEIKIDGGTSQDFYYTGNPFDPYYPGYGYGYFDYYTQAERSFDIKAAVQLNYIDIPIGVKYATDEGFELSGGIIVSLLVSDKIKASVDYDGTNNNSYYEDYLEDELGNDYEDAFGEDPEEFLTGLQIGVGYTFNERFNVSFKLQQTGSFGEIDGYGDENNNLTLQLSTGYYF